MFDYAIGDIQGCYDKFMHLLELINFDEKRDKLWFVGDLVNRGPQSLAVLRFIYSLPNPAKICLGNHDLHLLSCLFTGTIDQDDTLHDIILAEDGIELGHWLRKQAILCYSKELNVVMCHAGIAPMWDLALAQSLAKELEEVLAGERFHHFLNHMYGNKPDIWSHELKGMDRLRIITNYFTRMRFCDASGRLNLVYKGPVSKAPSGLYPWYEVPGRQEIAADIIFGHWASLRGYCPNVKIHALDHGCLWGGKLAALRLQDKQLFTISCE